MTNFTEYNLNPQKFAFLNSLQENWQKIRDEFTHYIHNLSPSELKFTYDIMGPKSNTIKTKSSSKYSAFGVLFQGIFIEEYIQTHQIQYPDYQSFDVFKEVRKIREQYFPILSQTITTVNSIHQNIIRNVYFGTFHPGLDIKLHTNYNPHMNRGYLGLIVPEGDIAMKICHEKLHWHEGEFMVLDHSYPHCPHNYTNYDRTVLVVDFFKPERPWEEVIQFEQELVNQRMQDNPYSLGVFGKSDRAKEEDFIKYGLAHQLEWDKALGG